VEDYNEGLFVIAVYIFVATAFSLPPLIVYLFIKILKVINRMNNFLNYATEGEEESRKYHD
jgi:hypothetical protein